MSLAGNFVASSNQETAPIGVSPEDAEQQHPPTSFGRAKGGASSGDIIDQEIHQLAKEVTQQNTLSRAGQNPFAAESGSTLDPNGEIFDVRAWCKAMLQIHTDDKQAHPLRTVGVAFNDLNVHGFGSDTDYQKSVGNIWFEILALAKKFMGQRQHKIKILQNLEGLVEAGEMLVVLGPPGSGCSTFLKTITGETHGFFVDKTSNINFQGMFDVMHARAPC